MAELQFPNMYNAVQQGLSDGRSQLATRLAGQAFNAPADQRQSSLSQLAGVDPRMAMGMSDRFQQQDQAQQAQAKAQEVDHAQKINGAANFMLQAVQTKDPARIQGAYQAVKPYLAELGAAQGLTPPDQFTPDMLPHLYQIVSQTGGAPQQKGTVVAPGGALVDSATGQQMFANPAAPANGQLVDIPDGQGGTVKMLFDPKTRQLSQPNYGGGQGQPAPQGGMQTQLTPVGSSPVDQANAFLAQGMPPDKAAALAMGAHPGTTLAVDPASGQFKDVSDGSAMLPQGQLTQAPQHGLGYAPPKGDKQVRTLSDAELKQYNLPAGTVAQMDGNGKISVVNKPGQDSSTVTPPGDPTQTGDAYLQSLPANMRSVVKAIAHGDQAPPSASSRSPAAQALLQAVYTYDPTASASNLPTRTATRKSFTSGKDAQNMTALSQLALHLDHLNGQVDSISGLAAPNFVNGAINAVTDKSNGKTTAFESSANAVAHELRAVFANAGGGTEAELEQNLKQLNSSNSLAQKKAAIANIAQLVHGRFGILQDKYAQGMGKSEDPFQTSYPGAEETILRLAGATHDAQPAQQPASGGVDHLLSKYGVQ